MVDQYERHGIFPNDLIIFNNSNDNILLAKERYIQQVRYVPHHILQARQFTELNYVNPVVILIADIFAPSLPTFPEIKAKSFLMRRYVLFTNVTLQTTGQILIGQM